MKKGRSIKSTQLFNKLGWKLVEAEKSNQVRFNEQMMELIEKMKIASYSQENGFISEVIL